MTTSKAAAGSPRTQGRKYAPPMMKVSSATRLNENVVKKEFFSH